MSRVTVKKIKVAAARRPAGGADGSVALPVPSAETSSGSVIRGSGVVTGGGGAATLRGMRGEGFVETDEFWLRYQRVG